MEGDVPGEDNVISGKIKAFIAFSARRVPKEDTRDRSWSKLVGG